MCPGRYHYILAAMLFTLLFVYGSFVPLEFKAIDVSQAIEKFRAVPYLRLNVYSRADFVANLLLMIPIGYLWVGALDTHRRGPLALMMGLPCLVAALAAMIVGVEFAQLWFPRRTVSQNDMLAESVGAGIGILGWFLIGRRMTSWLGQFFSHKTNRIDWRISLLRLYRVGLLIYMLIPMDVVISPQELQRKFEGGRISLVPFTVGYDTIFELLWQVGVDVILYVPIGMGMRLGRLPRKGIRTLTMAVGLTLCFAVGIEVIQLFIFSRSVDATDVVTGGVGGASGAWLAGLFWLRPALWPTTSSLAGAARARWGLLWGGLYVVPLVASFWYPFDWVNDPDEIGRKLNAFIDYPFKRYYWGQEFVTFVNLARGWMLFVPVGAGLRWIMGQDRAQRWIGRLGLLCVVVMLGLVIEFGQAMTYTGVCDVTDVGVYLVGAIVGWALAGRLLARHGAEGVGS